MVDGRYTFVPNRALGVDRNLDDASRAILNIGGALSDLQAKVTAMNQIVLAGLRHPNLFNLVYQADGVTVVDDHTQYAFLPGRATGQTFNGGIAAGENLTLSSTAHLTKGVVAVSDPLRLDTLTDLGVAATRFAAFDAAGASVVYYRTAAEVLSDIGASPVVHTHPYTDVVNVTPARLLGRTTAGVGATELISTGSSMNYSAGTLNTVQGIRTVDSPTFAGLTLNSVADLGAANGRYVVLDDAGASLLYYRTAAEVLSDIGAAPASSISGTLNYIAKFTSATAVGNGIGYDDGTNLSVGCAGAASAGAKLDVNGFGVFRSTTTMPSAGGASLEVGYNGTAGYGYIAARNQGASTYLTTMLSGNPAIIQGYSGVGSAYQVHVADGYGVRFLYSVATPWTANQLTAFNIIANQFGGFGESFVDGGVTFAGYNNAASASTRAVRFIGHVVNEPTGYSAVDFVVFKQNGAAATLTTILGTSYLAKFVNYTTTVVAVDGAGNVRFGGSTTLSGSATYTTVQVGGLCSVMSDTAVAAGATAYFINNAYYDGSWKHIAADEASVLTMQDGIFKWYSSVAGIVGGAVAFVEYMRLTAAGLLGIGTSSPDRLLHAEVTGASSGATVYAQRLSRAHTTTAAGLTTNDGTGFEIELETATNGTNHLAAGIEAYWTDAAALSSAGQLAFSTGLGGTLARRMEITGAGKIVLNAYTAGVLETDASGIIYARTYNTITHHHSGLWESDDGAQSLYISSLGEVSIGAAAVFSSERLYVSSAVGEYAGRFARNNTATNAAQGTIYLMAISTQTVVDGYGVSLDFGIQGLALARTIIGSILVIRNGADNSGKINFQPKNVGTGRVNMTIDNLGKTVIGYGIGAIAGQSLLHVYAGASGTTPLAGTLATIEGNGNSYLTLLAPDASARGINFGCASDNVYARILCDCSGVYAGVHHYFGVYAYLSLMSGSVTFNLNMQDVDTLFYGDNTEVCRINAEYDNLQMRNGNEIQFTNVTTSDGDDDGTKLFALDIDMVYLNQEQSTGGDHIFKIGAAPGTEYARVSQRGVTIPLGLDGGYIHGSYTVNNSWRQYTSGNNLLFSRRESGSWVDKVVIDPQGAVLIRTYNQTTEPTTSQVPAGFAAIWTDTDDSKCYLCYNHGGTVKTVELL